MKKITTLLCISLFLPHMNAQETRPPGSNTLGFGIEVGGKTTFATDVKTYNDYTRNESTNSSGVSFFYEHAFYFGRRSAFSIGGGVNATMFNTHLYYTNPKVSYTESAGPNSTKETTISGVEHDLRRNVHSFYAVDIPLLYSLRFLEREKWNAGFYTGIKIRNVSYIFGEQRNRSVSVGTLEKDGQDTLFYMGSLTHRGGMRNSRVVPNIVLGAKVSKTLASGGQLNFYADYNIAFGNEVEMRYRGFDNTEYVSVYEETVSDGQVVSSGSYRQTLEFDWTVDNALFLALKMSHLRFGISYTLPAR